MRRLIIALVPLLIAPLIALSALAWSLAGQAEDQLLASQQRYHNELISRFESAYVARLGTLTAPLLQWAAHQDWGGSVAEAPSAGQTWLLVLDNRERWLYPSSVAPSSSPQQPLAEDHAVWLGRLAEARRYENSAGLPDLAAERYVALDRPGVPDVVRAAALLSQARCLCRADDSERARLLYRHLIDGFGHTIDETGTNYAVEAMAGYLRLVAARGDSDDTIRAWREYADALASRRYSTAWPLYLRHLNDAVSLAPPQPDQQDTHRLAGLKAAAMTIEQMAEAASIVAGTATADTSRLAIVGDHVAVGRVADASDEVVWVVASFAIDWVVEHVLWYCHTALDIAEGAGLAVRDPSGRMLAGSELLPDAVTTEASLLDTGLPWMIQVGFTHLPATRAWATRRHALLTGSVAALVALIAVGVTLTLRMLRREMELSKLKSDFVDNVSHELRTPVTSIKMFSQMLLGDRIDADRRREYYRLLAASSDRLAGMIENMLNFSRIVAGRMSLQPTATDVREYVTRLAQQLQIQARPTGHRINLHMGQNLGQCRIDGEAFSRAIANLVANAIKYSPDDREIGLTARRRDDMLSIAVRDRGIGIDPEDLPHVFERFYRATRSGDGAHVQGTGLGLTIVKETVERHGGTVRVDSTPGRGTVVEILIPVETGAEPE